jgi:purine-cytosine permease-like protein
VWFKASRAVTVAIDGVVAVSLTIYALFISNFLDSLNSFLSLSIAVVGPCIAIYVTDSLLRRHRYDGLQLSDESPQSPFWYDNGICWPGVVAEGLGAFAALLCINSPVLVGPVARALKGADLSAIMGPVVAAGVYFAMMRGVHRMERERQLQGAALVAEDFVDAARRDQSVGD